MISYHRRQMLRQILREFLNVNITSVETGLTSLVVHPLLKFVYGEERNCCTSTCSLLLSLLGVFTDRSIFLGLALLLSL